MRRILSAKRYQNVIELSLTSFQAPCHSSITSPRNYPRAGKTGEKEVMNYDPQDHQHQLLHDLADGIVGVQALDQAVSVLVEWGLIDADLAGEYIREIEGAK